MGFPCAPAAVVLSPNEGLHANVLKRTAPPPNSIMPPGIAKYAAVVRVLPNSLTRCFVTVACLGTACTRPLGCCCPRQTS